MLEMSFQLVICRQCWCLRTWLSTAPNRICKVEAPLMIVFAIPIYLGFFADHDALSKLIDVIILVVESLNARVLHKLTCAVRSGCSA
jgi:hypothetical protein